jgi:hypothetical protein
MTASPMKRPLLLAVLSFTAVVAQAPVFADDVRVPKNPFQPASAAVCVAPAPLAVSVRSVGAMVKSDAFFEQPEVCYHSGECGGPSYCDQYFNCGSSEYVCLASPRTGIGHCYYLADCPSCQPALADGADALLLARPRQ